MGQLPPTAGSKHMNWSKLKDSIGHRVKIRPEVISRWPDGSANLTDDDWIIARVSKQAGVCLSNIRTQHWKSLGADHIKSYFTDPSDLRDGVTHGFLALHSQLTLSGVWVLVEPITR